MPILSDREIKEAIAQGKIKASPAFPEENIKGANVDLTLGEEAFRATDEAVQKLGPGRFLRLSPGDIALVTTRERLEVDTSLAGHIGLRSYFARKGLLMSAGPQIDPGFRGNLHVVLVNLSPSENILGYGEAFCTVEFHSLAVPVEKPYQGPYLGQTFITQQEIEDIRKGRGYALNEVLKDMQNIARDIGELKNTVSTHAQKIDSYLANAHRDMNIFVGAVVALTVTIIGAIVAVLLRLFL